MASELKGATVVDDGYGTPKDLSDYPMASKLMSREQLEYLLMMALRYNPKFGSPAQAREDILAYFDALREHIDGLQAHLGHVVQENQALRQRVQELEHANQHLDQALKLRVIEKEQCYESLAALTARCKAAEQELAYQDSCIDQEDHRLFDRLAELLQQLANCEQRIKTLEAR